MADKTTPPTASGPAPASDVTTPTAPAPASTAGKIRSGLTGHLLPSFWRTNNAAANPASTPALAAAPNADGTATPALPANVSRGRWWPNRLSHGESVGRATILIILCAVLSLGIYFYGTLRFPLTGHLTPPLLDIGKFTNEPSGAYNPVAGELFLFSICLLFAAWGLVCWIAGRIEQQAKKGWWRTPWLLGGTLYGFPLVALWVLLFMYPITAADIFDYISQIRVMTIYHTNPLTIPPSAFPFDPFFRLNTWPTMPVSYGPLWALLSAMASQPAGNDVLSAVINQKLLTIAACLGCMAFVWLLARRLCPERHWQVFVFFAWNPLVLFETGANGHNDAIMVFFMLAGLLALLSSRWYWQSLALPLLVASVLVKWTSVLLIPLAIIYLLRGGRIRRYGMIPLGVGTLISAAFAMLVVAPFWDTRHPWGIVQQSGFYTSTPLALLHSLLTPIYPTSNGQDPAGTVVHLIGVVTFGLVYLWLLVRLAFPGVRERLGPDASVTLPQRLIAASVDSYFWYFVLATFWFKPWYLVALLPLAALDPRSLARVRSALFAVGAALSYVVYVFLWVIYLRLSPPFTVDFIACFTIYAPPLLTRALESWQNRKRLYLLLEQALFPPALVAGAATRRRKSRWLL